MHLRQNGKLNTNRTQKSLDDAYNGIQYKSSNKRHGCPQGQSSTANIGHAEALCEHTHSGKMAHISINMCDNQNL